MLVVAAEDLFMRREHELRVSCASQPPIHPHLSRPVLEREPSHGRTTRVTGSWPLLELVVELRPLRYRSEAGKVATASGVVVRVCADVLLEAMMPLLLVRKLLVRELKEEVVAFDGRVIRVKRFDLEPVVAPGVVGKARERPVPVVVNPEQHDVLEARAVTHSRSVVSVSVAAVCRSLKRGWKDRGLSARGRLSVLRQRSAMSPERRVRTYYSSAR